MVTGIDSRQKWVQIPSGPHYFLLDYPVVGA